LGVIFLTSSAIASHHQRDLQTANGAEAVSRSSETSKHKISKDKESNAFGKATPALTSSTDPSEL